MTDEQHPQQPEVLEGHWDLDQVDALFSDLKRGAEVRQVKVRTKLGISRPEDSVVTLEQARELLDDGRTTAIQIHYDYDGKTWCDTLIVLPDTIRIVRTTLPSNH